MGERSACPHSPLSSSERKRMGRGGEEGGGEGREREHLKEGGFCLHTPVSIFGALCCT